MAVARVQGIVLIGVNGIPVTVEVDVAQGLPTVGMVGLARGAVAEARWRARSAITNTGLLWPTKRITIGLSPADLPKSGTGLDLPIALGLLVATDQLAQHLVDDAAFIGELALDGSVLPVPEAMAAALTASRNGIARLYVPRDAAAHLAAVPGVEVIAIRDLAHLVSVLRGERTGCVIPAAPSDGERAEANDFAEVRGHELAKYGLEVAAAGGHHVAMSGPPGVGKSMLGHRFATLLPDLDDADALDVTSLLALAGELPSGRGLVRRPITQAPHHTTTAAAFLGTASGARILPGVITRAHRGVLFMDEAPEFTRPCLEGLRQPLESGVIAVARVGAVTQLPASFQLVLASNPCPCGLSTGRGEECTCAGAARTRYAARLSGPLLDRIDVRLHLSRPVLADLGGDEPESSTVIRARVTEARDRAARRFIDAPWSRNADIPARALRLTWHPTPAGAAVLQRALGTDLSLRGSDRVLRMAWSIADLQGVGRPGSDEVATALALRGAELSSAA